jgi:hypothetical protein
MWAGAKKVASNHQFAARASSRQGPAMNLPDLSISDEKLCFIIAKAREFDVKDVVTDPDDASNPADDAMLAVLEDHKDDPVVQELTAAYLLGIPLLPDYLSEAIDQFGIECEDEE